MKASLLPAVAIAATIFCASSGRALAQSLRDWPNLARQMVDREVAGAGVKNERVLRAMRETPRHEFVPANLRERAYYDMALPIGASQTISPPFIVASMTEAIDPQPSDRVLEIGTGSGYQAAVLSPLVQDVYSIEIVESLGRRASRTLKRLGYKNIHTKTGDGYLGWPDAAPFDKIIVTCSPEKVPQPLVDQLRDGGLMIVPVGERYQQVLYLFRKVDGRLKSEALRPTLFVPMTGEAEQQRDVKPDPLRPSVENGSFEEVIRNADEGGSGSERASLKPSGWHYQRQLELVTDPSNAPEGDRFVMFRNQEPGRGCQALQGFAIDGRKVSELELAYSVRGNNIRPGPEPFPWPKIYVTFYGDDRGVVGEHAIGRFLGSFDWRDETQTLHVPLRAREAILRIGLLGASGELSFDNLRFRVPAPK